ncbi:hypothetical protein HYALB_00005735 [Hymenoscyphus albidus]|uniref:Protein kinase domain-containing protein n=1 Tax=Hymenoscyphus albidus TaxID=595503 RepID=A0A9N9LLH7_9HELO|nr:hypothetical protein HYALB_00005735 [Hymenoscyphus albidus]
MFCGQDQDGSGYRTRMHLAEIIGLLGMPPVEFLKSGLRSRNWFEDDGTWNAGIEILQDATLEKSEERLEEGENKDMFMRFMRGMLQWRPEDRKTVKELLDDPWLNRKV